MGIPNVQWRGLVVLVRDALDALAVFAPENTEAGVTVDALASLFVAKHFCSLLEPALDMRIRGIGSSGERAAVVDVLCLAADVAGRSRYCRQSTLCSLCSVHADTDSGCRCA
jgi:hypothetical protein